MMSPLAQQEQQQQQQSSAATMHFLSSQPGDDLDFLPPAASPTSSTTMTTTMPRRSAMKKRRQLSNDASASSSSRLADHFYYTLDAHRSTALELNGMGADLLECGEHLSAIETLRDAVEFLSRPAVRIHAGDDMALLEYAQKNNAAIARAETRLFEAKYNDRDAKSGSGKKKKSNVADEDGPLLIYAEPIRLSSTNNNRGGGGGVCDEEAAAAVLFNLALAHHLVGASSSLQGQQQQGQQQHLSASHKRSMLDKSLVFYEMCVSAMLKIDLPEDAMSSIEDGGVPHLARAVLNNSGQICLRYGSHAMGRKYFADLASILRRSDDGCDMGCVVVRADEGMDLFSFNAMVAGQLNAAPTA